MASKNARACNGMIAAYEPIFHAVSAMEKVRSRRRVERTLPQILRPAGAERKMVLQVTNAPAGL